MKKIILALTLLAGVAATSAMAQPTATATATAAAATTTSSIAVAPTATTTTVVGKTGVKAPATPKHHWFGGKKKKKIEAHTANVPATATPSTGTAVKSVVAPGVVNALPNSNTVTPTSPTTPPSRAFR